MKQLNRALLIALETNEKTRDEVLYSLTELKELCQTLEIEVVDKLIQNLDRPTGRFYIGSGKVEEIKKNIEVLDIDMVIFDDPLSPAQIRNLESTLEVTIMDRSFIILQIFADRATTREAVLEVELAQKTYMLPRLVGMYNSLSRQAGTGGSFSAKGPGETKLEMDRRRLQNDITKIKKELRIVEQEQLRSRHRRQENQVPIVALVGYTNAGKSALMNSLSKILSTQETPVFEKDMLFATLDTKARRLQKTNYPPFILIDTVGFISKLPHELVKSFKTTLRDVRTADLILHIVDGSRPDEIMIETTKNVLKELGASEVERITILTKKDLTTQVPEFAGDYTFISNATGENVDILVELIYQRLFKNSKTCEMLIPFKQGDMFHEIKTNCHVISHDFHNDGYYIKAVLTPNQADKYQSLIIKNES